MKIIVNDIAASQTGALAVLKSFYKYIKEYDNENDYVFLLNDKYIEETERIKVCIRKDIKKSGFNKLWFDFITGKDYINNFNPDYVLSLQNIITFGLKCRQGVYVHQAIPFQDIKKFSFLKKSERVYAVYQYLIGQIIKKSIKKSEDVFVQTKWMKKAVAQKSKVNENKIQVVPFEVPLIYQEKTKSLNGKKFFYPTADENVYKNHRCIYSACEILQENGFDSFEITLTLSADGRKENRNINYCGFLSNEQMINYYKNSVLIFPSFIETVGLPLLEAKSLGSIIFAADCPYSHEVLEDYKNAYYFDPKNSESLAKLMRQSINGEITLKNSGEIDYKEYKETWQIVLNQMKKK